jgi:hypothetical protein
LGGGGHNRSRTHTLSQQGSATGSSPNAVDTHARDHQSRGFASFRTIAHGVSRILAGPRRAREAWYARLWLGHRQRVLEALHSVRRAPRVRRVGVRGAHTRRGPAGSAGARRAGRALEWLRACWALLRGSVGAVAHTTGALAGARRAQVAALEDVARRGGAWAGRRAGGTACRPSWSGH